MTLSLMRDSFSCSRSLRLWCCASFPYPPGRYLDVVQILDRRFALKGPFRVQFLDRCGHWNDVIGRISGPSRVQILDRRFFFRVSAVHAPSAGVSAGTVVERRVRVDPRGMGGRTDAEQHPGQDRDEEREGQ